MMSSAFKATIPDAAIASTYLAAWAFPAMFGASVVDSLSISMVLEIWMVVLASPLAVEIVFDRQQTFRQRLIPLTFFCLIFCGTCIAVAKALQSLLPVLMLSLSLFLKIRAKVRRVPGDRGMRAQEVSVGEWKETLVSIVLYMIVMAVVLPVGWEWPTLYAGVESALPRIEGWQSVEPPPYSLLTAGALYFAVMAAWRWREATRAP